LRLAHQGLVNTCKILDERFLIGRVNRLAKPAGGHRPVAILLRSAEEHVTWKQRIHDLAPLAAGNPNPLDQRQKYAMPRPIGPTRGPSPRGSWCGRPTSSRRTPPGFHIRRHDGRVIREFQHSSSSLVSGPRALRPRRCTMFSEFVRPRVVSTVPPLATQRPHVNGAQPHLRRAAQRQRRQEQRDPRQARRARRTRFLRLRPTSPSAEMPCRKNRNIRREPIALTRELGPRSHETDE